MISKKLVQTTSVVGLPRNIKVRSALRTIIYILSNTRVIGLPGTTGENSFTVSNSGPFPLVMRKEDEWNFEITRLSGIQI